MEYLEEQPKPKQRNLKKEIRKHFRAGIPLAILIYYQCIVIQSSSFESFIWVGPHLFGSIFLVISIASYFLFKRAFHVIFMSSLLLAISGIINFNYSYSQFGLNLGKQSILLVGEPFMVFILYISFNFKNLSHSFSFVRKLTKSKDVDQKRSNTEVGRLMEKYQSKSVLELETIQNGTHYSKEAREAAKLELYQISH